MKVYVLFHCDEWQSYASYRLIGVVSEDCLEDAYGKIKEECNYNDEEMETYIATEECDLDDLENLDI